MYQIIWHITWPHHTLTFAGNFLHTNSLIWFWLVTFSRNANFWQNGKQSSPKAKRLKLFIFPTWRAHCSHCLVLVLCSDSLPTIAALLFPATSWISLHHTGAISMPPTKPTPQALAPPNSHLALHSGFAPLFFPVARGILLGDIDCIDLLFGLGEIHIFLNKSLKIYMFLNSYVVWEYFNILMSIFESFSHFSWVIFYVHFFYYSSRGSFETALKGNKTSRH